MPSEVAVKRASIPFMVVLFLLFITLAAAQEPARTHAAKPKATVLTLDDILSCLNSPTMEFLGRRVDEIRANSKRTEGNTTYYEEGVEIRWLADTNDEAIISHISDSDENPFCGVGTLYIFSLEGRKVEPRTIAIHRMSTDWFPYTLDVQQIFTSNYTRNHPFSQEQGVFQNSDEQSLTITLDPVHCDDIKITDVDGKHPLVIPMTKSKIGVALQWKKEKDKNEWVFYRAMYTPPGCSP